MRPIKFRGKCIENGRFVYGKFVYGDLKHMTGGRIGISFDKRIAAVEVEPESVAQLVGYDANGNEVYEGDVVIRYDSEEEFNEAPENGVLREVTLYIQVVPDLNSYYCFLKGD